MTNLFSVFDPSTRIFGRLRINWMAIVSFLVFPSGFWLNRGGLEKVLKTLILILSAEIKINTKEEYSRSRSLILTRVFMAVLARNFFGLAPYVFTASRHPVFTFVLAGSSWTGYIIYSVRINPSNFLSHLAPRGTPIALVPFIVLIELVRRIIRPLTLAVRLAANMVAGHLLLVLVRGPAPTISWPVLSVAFTGVVALLVLETGVSFIQRYVFISLSSLYVGELNANNL